MISEIDPVSVGWTMIDQYTYEKNDYIYYYNKCSKYWYLRKEGEIGSIEKIKKLTRYELNSI